MPDAGHRSGRPLGFGTPLFSRLLKGLPRVEAALHSAEKQRIAALRSSTRRAEEEFDDIVRVVSAICETPISVINLIDHGRQWFRAEVQAIATVHQQRRLPASMRSKPVSATPKSDPTRQARLD
jgi:hypothetical protein